MQLTNLAPQIIAVQVACMKRWDMHPSSLVQEGFFALIEENHAFNFQLWHAEDRARRDDKGEAFVYQAKREIDYCNQQRNNRMEAIDNWLFDRLKPAAVGSCPAHSETPGMIIDRLSILTLKCFHMQQQTVRVDVDEAHLQACLKKFSILQQQHRQLGLCLQALFDEVIDKKRTFCVYHQFKMYNDPTLNPQLYHALSSTH